MVLTFNNTIPGTAAFGQAPNSLVTSVVFDLGPSDGNFTNSENQLGAISVISGNMSTTNNASSGQDQYIPNFQGDPGILGTGYDYGEWIATSNPNYYELVPYFGPVPEPSTVFGGLALLGFIGWRERRRLSLWYSRFFPTPVRVDCS